jgi:hypothetical protein
VGGKSDILEGVEGSMPNILVLRQFIAFEEKLCCWEQYNSILIRGRQGLRIFSPVQKYD